MISKNQIKLIRSLAQKKHRKETGLFILEGVKLFEEAVQANAEFHSIYSLDDENISHPTIQVKNISPKELTQISKLKSANKVLAVVKQRQPKTIDYSNWIVCVESLNDPGNLGTIIRTMDWFGFSHLVLSNDSVDLYNQKVVQSSMGSIFRVNVHYQDMQKFLSEAKSKNKQILGTTLEGSDYLSMNFSKPQVLVFGSESHGINNVTKNMLTKQIKILGAGNTESLNLGVSVGIVLSKI